MRATGLRIGNLVSMPDKSVKEISAIDLFQFSEHFSPIPLTEEWLEKFGFEKRNNEYILDELFVITNENQQGNYLYWNTGNSYDVRLEYVHQLQNLYFALTNSELQIKQTV